MVARQALLAFLGLLLLLVRWHQWSAPPSGRTVRLASCNNTPPSSTVKWLVCGAQEATG